MLDSYKIFNCDRRSGWGGGIIYLRLKDLQDLNVLVFNTNMIDIFGLDEN